MEKAQAQELYDALTNARRQMVTAQAALIVRVGEEPEQESYVLRDAPYLRVVAEATAAAMQKLARAQSLVVRAVLA